MQIFVKVPGERTVSLEVEGRDTMSAVKHFSRRQRGMSLLSICLVLRFVHLLASALVDTQREWDHPT